MTTFLFNRILRSVPDKTDWFIGTDILVNKKFPIVFRSVDGTCVKSGSSFINEKEVDEVISCLNILLKDEWNGRLVFLDDIGIVTPYSAQSKIIRSRTSHFGNITIKSPESFQGQERNIIIVSTVRTGPLGFVSDERVRQSFHSFYIVNNN